MFLSRGAFRDYETLKELLAITPTQEQRAFHLYWKEVLLDTPFFESLAIQQGGGPSRYEAINEVNNEILSNCKFSAHIRNCKRL